MKTLASTVLTAVLGMGAVAVFAAPAQAGTGTGSYVEVSASNVKVPAGKCRRARFVVTPRQQFADWEATLEADDPNMDLEVYESMSPSHTTYKDRFCSYFHNPRGVYDVTLDFTGYDENGDVVASETVYTSFRYKVLPKLASRLTVRAKHVRHRFWTIDGVLKRQGEGWAGQKVRVEARLYGDWYNINAKFTRKGGHVHWTARPKKRAGRFLLRLHYLGSDTTKSAVSKTFRIYP